MEEITPLVTGLKSYIYTLPTGRNYAVSYYRKVLHKTGKRYYPLPFSQANQTSQWISETDGSEESTFIDVTAN